MFEEDIVAERHAVRDHRHVDLRACRRAVPAGPCIGALDAGQMRCVEGNLVVTGPDDFFCVQDDVRECACCVMRVGDDLLVAGLKAIVVVDEAVVRVAIADIFDFPCIRFPDAMGDPDNVVDDVAIIGIEA